MKGFKTTSGYSSIASLPYPAEFLVLEKHLPPKTPPTPKRSPGSV